MKLVIDPGHGGTDPGASEFGYLEKDLNLIVAKRVKELLKDYNPDITRETDITLESNTRAAAIKDKYDYCLSIHFNAGGGSGIEAIHSIHSTKGKELGQSIAEHLKEATGLNIRRVFSRRLGTVDYYFMHRLTGNTCTVIVEVFFIDNIEDIKALNIESISQGIAEGFRAFIEKKVVNVKHYKVSLTDIVELDPLDLKISLQDKAANKIPLDNFVTSGYQWHHSDGTTYPLGILVSEGRVLSNRQPHGLPAGTLIVYKDGTVEVKRILDISHEKYVWFAVSGCSILPSIGMKYEGFVGKYADIGRVTDRPVIGYNPTTKKIVIAVRPASNIARGQTTLKNLGCDKGITLDGGGSTVLKVKGRLIKSTSRRLYSVITW